MERHSRLSAIAAIALLSLAAPLQAQRSVPAAIDRGSMIIDGSASLSRTRFTTEGAGTDSKVTTTQIAFLPSLLYFVAPRFAIGGSVELSHVSSGPGTTSTVGAGPAARLYFAGAGSTVLPYVGTSVRALRFSLDADGTTSSPATTQWGVEGVAGITWLFSRQVGIVTEAFAHRLSYGSSAFGNAPATDATSTEFGLRVGIAAFIPRGR